MSTIKEEIEKLEEKVLGKDVQSNSTAENVQVPVEEPKAEKADVPAVKMYMGKQIISDNMQTINEKEYHSLRLSDGSTHALTHSEYEELVK